MSDDLDLQPERSQPSPTIRPYESKSFSQPEVVARPVAPYVAGVLVLASAIGFIVYQETRSRTPAKVIETHLNEVATGTATSTPETAQVAPTPVIAQEPKHTEPPAPPAGASMEDWLQKLESEGPGSDAFNKAQQIRKLMAGPATQPPTSPVEIALPPPIAQEESPPVTENAAPSSKRAPIVETQALDASLVTRKRADLERLKAKLFEKQDGIQELIIERSTLDAPIETQARRCDAAAANANDLSANSMSSLPAHDAYRNAVNVSKHEQKALTDMQKQAASVDDKIKTMNNDIRSLERDIKSKQEALDKLVPPTNAELFQREKEETLRNASINGEVMIGMNKSQVLRAWGKPEKFTTEKSGGNTNDLWIYLRDTGFVHFQNGIVWRIAQY